MGEGNRLVFCKINNEMKEVSYIISIANIIVAVNVNLIINIDIIHFYYNALVPQRPSKI